MAPWSRSKISSHGARPGRVRTQRHAPSPGGRSARTRLTPPEVHALAGAVAWQWQPLALPVRGSFVTARSAALAAARAAGRSGAAAAADAREAGSRLAGGLSTAGSWSWAENGLAGVLIGDHRRHRLASGRLIAVRRRCSACSCSSAAVVVLLESSWSHDRGSRLVFEAAALAPSSATFSHPRPRRSCPVRGPPSSTTDGDDRPARLGARRDLLPGLSGSVRLERARPQAGSARGLGRAADRPWLQGRRPAGHRRASRLPRRPRGERAVPHADLRVGVEPPLPHLRLLRGRPAARRRRRPARAARRGARARDPGRPRWRVQPHRTWVLAVPPRPRGGRRLALPTLVPPR